MKKKNHLGKGKIKVGILTTSYPRYSGDPAGIFVFELARNLYINGVDVEVVAPHDPDSQTDDCLDGVTVHRFRYAWPTPLERLAYRGGILPNLKKDFLAKLQLPLFLLSFLISGWRLAKRCDLIHVHWLQNGWLAVLYKIFFNRPVVLTVHGTDANELSANKGMRWLNRLILQKVDKVIAVSEDIKNKICQLGLSRERIVVLPNGVPDQTAFLSLPAKERHGYSLLFVGRLIRSKNIKLLIEAVAYLRARFPLIKLIIVGQGPMRTELEDYAGELNIAQQVRFVGGKDRREIIDFYRDADLFISPSKAEGFSLVVLEALAAGLPVIATKVGIAPEIIRHKENGWLVPIDDRGALEEAICTLFTDAALRREIAEESRKTITDKFGWKTIAKNTISLYQMLIRM